MTRDKNGYAIVKVGTRKFFITPYDGYYAVRNVKGLIERTQQGQQLVFRTESDAVGYLQQKP